VLLVTLGLALVRLVLLFGFLLGVAAPRPGVVLLVVLAFVRGLRGLGGRRRRRR
jgi:hypothetical protein